MREASSRAIGREPVESDGDTGTAPAFRAQTIRLGSCAGICRAGRLTAYEVETLAAEAVSMGAGTRVEVTLTGDADDAALGRTLVRFASLAKTGIEVRMRHDPLPSAVFIE